MKTLLCLLACGCSLALAQTPPAAKLPSSDPVLIDKADAAYPPEARAARLQGTVYLYLEVNPEGTPENVHVMHGLGLDLDESAVEAVKRWRFKPGIREGLPERVEQSAVVQFTLEGAGPWRVRQAAYRVADKARAALVKPVLARYAGPDAAACPADGGSATVALSIGEDGRPRDIKPLHPGDPVGEAAAKAIESWQFRPGTANGEPREAGALIEFECGTSPLPSPEMKVSRVGNGVSPPAATFRPEPQYSEEARAAKIQGGVMLQMVIDSTGHPTRLRVLEGAALGLDEKAIETVLTWRFKPAMRDEKPVNVLAQVQVNFRLKD